MLSQINSDTKRKNSYINPITGVATPGPWPRRGKTERDRNRGALQQRFANMAARAAWQQSGRGNDAFPVNAAGGKGNSSKARKH